MLKRVISTSLRLAGLKNDTHRLLYTWIIPFLDIEGRLDADPRIIKGYIVPLLDHITTNTIKTALVDMEVNDLITLYTANGHTYLELQRFNKHQTLRRDKEHPSEIPSPGEVGSSPGVVREQSGLTPTEDKIREDKIREDKGEKRKRFIPPSISEIQNYCSERHNKINPQVFLDFYASKNWYVGKNKMTDWMAAIRTWESNDRQGGNGNGNNRPGFKQRGREEVSPESERTLDEINRRYREAQAAKNTAPGQTG